MERNTGIWLSAIGMVTLVALCPACHRDSIEQDLKEKSQQALQRANLPDWIVTIQGLDATLNGPKDQAAHARAVVAQVPGIWDVQLLERPSVTPTSSPSSPPTPERVEPMKLDPPPSPVTSPSTSPWTLPTPADSSLPPDSTAPSPTPLPAGKPTGLVQVLAYEGNVYLRGVYPTEESRQRALQAARATFGARVVRDETALSGTDEELGWPEEVLKGLSALTPVRDLELSAGGDMVTLSGMVRTAAQRQKLAGIVKASLPETVTLENRLTLPGETLSPVRPPAESALPPEARKAAQQTLNLIVDAGEVLFATASSRIRPEAYPYLNQLADTLKSQANATIMIGGHTDNQGKEADNRRLSQKRADAVRAYLVARGVPMRQLFAQGFGSTQPVGSNSTDEGRRRNRRIGFVVR
jgi:OmpA-OmpF porin, OOP family